MDIKQLIHDDDAVSPVIGVILMVAITVILAAVIASFVLGLGDQAQQATPQASFSWDFDESVGNSDYGVVTVTHDGGDTIDGNELYIRGDLPSSGTHGVSTYDLDADTGGDPTFANSNTVGETEVSAGTSMDVAASDSYDLRVVYETQEGDTSATLAQDTGPEA
ncbi:MULTISPECIES: type IV pilin [Haloarcula]|uniref:type IV pilin n=1 Tax=Haloarcula TaxID=2237 RepID=UPI000F8CB53F|nr:MULTISPECIES: type IV pilin N-terminal domain-containing protein [Haloarcula]NHX39087.1 type IV pilin [Haloarcula sp. R1-2]